MKIYLITDTHFNHAKMVEFCGRPENHTELIGNNLLNFGFTEQDILIHLGDICIGGDELVHQKYIMPLKCKKWLVSGNHDRKSKGWYLNHGWDWVGYQFSNIFLGKKILFSHTPLPQWSKNSYDVNIHGHWHNNDHHPEDMKNRNDKQKLLAIEYTNYLPVALDKFLSTEYKKPIITTDNFVVQPWV